MKVLIVYETLHGSAEKCAMILQEKLSYKTEVLRLKDNDNINLEDYDIVVVGGSIHMGVIHTRVKNFVENNLGTLLSKPHGLFLCCMEQGENAKIQFENAYPEKLRSTALVNGLFGGEYNFKKMNLFERRFTKKVSKMNSTISRLNMNEINEFAGKIEKFVISGGAADN